MKRIGIIGSGYVARSLAKGLIKHGHEVMAGSRSSSKREELQKETGALTGTLGETASFGEMVIFEVKGTVAEKVCQIWQKSLLIRQLLIQQIRLPKNRRSMA